MVVLLGLLVFATYPGISSRLPPGTVHTTPRGDHEWTASGPEGGYVNDFLLNNGFLYTAPLLNGAYWFDGAQWAPRRSGLEHENIVAFAGVGPGSLLAGLEGGGLWRSTNAGQDWNQNPSVPDTLSITALMRCDAATFVLAADHGGFFISIDVGATWTKPSDFLDTMEVRSLAHDNTTPPTIYCATYGQGLFSSSDLGATWNDRTEPNLLLTKIGHFNDGGVDMLYAGTSTGLFYGDAALWHATVLQGLPITDFALANDSTLVVATMGAGVFIGPLGDSLFVPIGTGLLYQTVTALEIAADTIFAGTCGGVFFTTDNGATWVERNGGLDATIIWDFATNPEHTPSAYAATFGGIFRTSDNGATWERFGTIPPLPAFTSIAVSPFDSMDIIVGGVYALQTSYDHGLSWSDFAIGYDWVNEVEWDPTNLDLVYACAGNNLFRSIDNGANWQGVDAGRGYHDVAVCLQAPETVYVATNSGVWKSNDHCANGSLYPVNGNLPAQPVACIQMDGFFPSMVYAGFEPPCPAAGALYRTVDGGAYWDTASYPELSVSEIITRPGLPFYLFAASYDSRVLLSLDGGTSWSYINPLFAGANMSLALGGNHELHTLYLGTLSGVFAYSDTIRPSLILAVPDSFSPDGDGLDDELVSVVAAQDTHKILYWNVSVYRDTVLIAERVGFGRPDTVRWDGFNGQGELVRNGDYYAVCYVIDGFLNYTVDTAYFAVCKRPMISGKATATQGAVARKVVSDGVNVHVVYVTYDPGEVFYTWSTDSGLTWSEPMDLSNTRDAYSINPCLVVDTLHRVYVFWEEEWAADSHEIVYQRLAGGSGLVGPRRLTTTAEPSITPVAAVGPDNDIHLAYQERSGQQEVIYLRYDAYLDDWGAPYNVSNTGGVSRDPAIVAQGSDVCVFFSDNTGSPSFDIRYRRYSGAGWLAESTLSVTSGQSLGAGAVADDQGILHVAWADSTGGNAQILYKHSRPAGWSPDTNLTGNAAASTRPGIGIDRLANVLVCYEAEGDVWRIVREHQQGWLPALNVSADGISRYPSASLQGEVVWTRNNTSPYDVVLFREPVTDTLGPSFDITVDDTLELGDSCHASILVDENLQALPQAWLLDSGSDSLAMTVTQDSARAYHGSVVVDGLTIGSGVLRVRGTDEAGNAGMADTAVYIDSLDSSVPIFAITAPDTCLVRDTLAISFTASEPLQGLPQAALRGTQDTIALDVVELTPTSFSASAYVPVIALGSGWVRVSGTDSAGNPGAADSAIVIDSVAIADTLPPQFSIITPSIAYIGDTITVVFDVNEQLAQVPAAFFTGAGRDSLALEVFEDSLLHYHAAVPLVGWDSGSAHVRIVGQDLTGNVTDTIRSLEIDYWGDFFPADSCFAFPNPTRENYVRFMFYVNRNAHVTFEIYTLSGRKLATVVEGEYEGGILHTETMSVAQLGTDIYVFRAIASAEDEQEIIVKKFAVAK